MEIVLYVVAVSRNTRLFYIYDAGSVGTRIQLER